MPGPLRSPWFVSVCCLPRQTERRERPQTSRSQPCDRGGFRHSVDTICRRAVRHYARSGQLPGAVPSISYRELRIAKAGYGIIPVADGICLPQRPSFAPTQFVRHRNSRALVAQHAERLQWVGLTRSPSRRRMAAICAKRTSGVDVQPSYGSSRWIPLPDRHQCPNQEISRPAPTTNR
jgi:ribosomal protein S14